MENCRKCSTPFDANGLSSGGMFGTCGGCLKKAHRAKVERQAFIDRFGTPDGENAYAAYAKALAECSDVITSTTLFR